MKENVARRVRNTRLTISKPLLPLFEAVANAIQAVHEAGVDDGSVSITMNREATLFSSESPESASVVGFTVKDNGVGFNADNYNSFTTADTDHKALLGGKGVGRFLWLVAFTRVTIESYYVEGNECRHRSFEFVKSPEGIHAHSDERCEPVSPVTTVDLIGLDERYKRQCPKSVDTLASYIVEHFLEFFLRPDCPNITLLDPTCRRPIDLNSYFESHIVEMSERESFELDGNEFHLLHVRLQQSHAREHFAQYCADSRVVRTDNLRGKIPDLTSRIADSDGTDFMYQVYVDSKFLDDNLNAERTDFTFVEDAGALLAGDMDWKSIRAEVHGRAARFLEPFTSPIRARKIERIENYVAQDAPMFRTVLKYAGDLVDSIDPDITDQSLELKLYQAYQAVQSELRSEGSEILRVKCSESDWETHLARVEKYFARATDINMSDLARYVCHRRAMLDFVQQRLALTAEARYHTEKLVHQLICPMGITSDQIGIESHNLWMVDERLVYHEFLASDKSLKNTGINPDSTKEPDILILDRAMAFVTGTDEPYAVCHLIEFKRPMRNEYDDKENPFTQLKKYIEDIRSGSATTRDGRKLSVHSDARFFCYVIADLTPKLKDWSELVQLQLAPDEQGYFGYHKGMGAYFEVISYDKMIADARKRNAAFFDKLGLPTRIRRESS